MNIVSSVQEGQDGNKPEREVKSLFVAFHTFPNTEGLRSLKTKRVGQLMAISGTVTRSSQVHKTLVDGTTCIIDMD
jgi:DNA replicative helicase MCM subunit Mcm2 (Cdc46/Mcm family)